jgi:serine/threonine protein kinase
MRPDRIGPYRIQEVFAEDALTVTYRAEDPGLGRTLLLKTARASAPSAAVRDRLLREAKLVAPLVHAGVLSLHGLVRKDDAVYLLFEDARGPRLSQVVARVKRLAVPQALAIAEGLAGAIAHLHGRGLVHGGLRPDRVALFPEGTVRIVDFSTAHTAGAAELDEEPQRAPEYLAPEQILSEGAGPRADVFSAGVILFELLTGQRPWDDPAPRAPLDRPAPRLQLSSQTIGYATPDALLALEDPLAPRSDPEGSGHALAHRVRNAPPPPLTTVDGPPPASVARIVSRCLAKDPADRYPDAAALAEDLADALREVSSEPASTLVVRALAAGDFLPAPPPKNERGPVELVPDRDVFARLLQQLAAVCGLIVFGALVTEVSRADERPAPPPSETPPGARGYLRVLAQPWAEVIVDGEPIDTTPMARPIAVAPGRHFVTFAHPNAPEEKRTVTVVAGQTVIVDVAMRVDRPQRDAGADSGYVDDSP